MSEPAKERLAGLVGFALATAAVVALAVLGSRHEGYWLVLIIPATIPFLLAALVSWLVFWDA